MEIEEKFYTELTLPLRGNWKIISNTRWNFVSTYNGKTRRGPRGMLYRKTKTVDLVNLVDSYKWEII